MYFRAKTADYACCLTIMLIKLVAWRTCLLACLEWRMKWEGQVAWFYREKRVTWDEMKNKREESYVKPQRINKGVGGTPFSHFYFPIILCDLLSIKSLMFHGASLLALSRSVLTFFLLIGKKWEKEALYSTKVVTWMFVERRRWIEEW